MTTTGALAASLMVVTAVCEVVVATVVLSCLFNAASAAISAGVLAVEVVVGEVPRFS